jgi:hypothetical protein
MNIKDLEKKNIRRCIASHPVLLLKGPEQTGVVRAVETVLEWYTLNEARQEAREMVWAGIHPDLVIYDGRELTAEDARNLRQFATSCPMFWDRRFVVISYIHRPHYTVMPILLKLIEEPPDHFSMVITTSNEGRVLPTILSRSLQLKVRPSDEHEVRWWLARSGKDEDGLRIKACGGDLDVAEKLDLPVIKEWYNDCSAVLDGLDFKKSFLATWTARLEEASESTQIACWDLLVRTVADVLNKHRFWAQVGLVAMEARNSAQNGHMNKMLLSTLLFKFYAVSKVILTRVK